MNIRKTLVCALCAALLICVTGCTAADKETKNETPDQGSQVQNTQVVNPIKNVESSADFSSLGITADAPDGASDISYSIISDTAAQVRFTLDGEEYTLRGSKEQDWKTLCGLYYDFGEDSAARTDDSEDAVTIELYVADESAKVAVWTTDGVTFTLCPPVEADNQAVLDLAGKIALN